jgi:hypothetical protein
VFRLGHSCIAAGIIARTAFLEIPSAVDSPMLIEPDGFIRRIDDSLGRATGLRAASASLRKRAGSSSKRMLCLDDGSGNLLDHADGR